MVEAPVIRTSLTVSVASIIVPVIFQVSTPPEPPVESTPQDTTPLALVKSFPQELNPVKVVVPEMVVVPKVVEAVLITISRIVLVGFILA